MSHDYESRWVYRAKWTYLLSVVGVLMLPVLYTLWISFNANGFGAAEYDFTVFWYVELFKNA